MNMPPLSKIQLQISDPTSALQSKPRSKRDALCDTKGYEQLDAWSSTPTRMPLKRLLGHEPRLPQTATRFGHRAAIGPRLPEFVSTQGMLASLIQTIEAKDPYTRGHCDRVGRDARGIAEMMGLPIHLAAGVELGAQLHDIGKIGMPDSILLKPTGLNDAEYTIVKTHTTIGAEIVAPLGLPESVRAAVAHHHERYDGRGYPTGLAGEDIPISARIVSVVDAYDAMSFNRVYREALCREKIVMELHRCSGKQFDPKVVEAFIEYKGI